MKILRYPNKSLSTPTNKWNFEVDKDLNKIVEEMMEIMHSKNGVALAANQIGIMKSVIVVDERHTLLPPMLINPTIYLNGETRLSSEGCLSFPGITLAIDRSLSVDCEYYDERFVSHNLSAANFNAFVLQHECDHLNGKTFLDRISRKDKFKVIESMMKRRV
jgi:peptide deformylase